MYSPISTNRSNARNRMMQQQTSLNGARAQTATPQNMQAPPMLNPYKTGNQTNSLEQQGMGPSQAMNASATNPSNNYATGGPVQSPQQPHPPAGQFDPKLIAAIAQAVATTPMFKGVVSPTGQQEQMQQMQGQAKPAPENLGDTLHQMNSQVGQQYQQTRQQMPQQQPAMAKGGEVAPSMHNMPLKDIIKMLASHPELAQGMSDKKPPAMSEGGGVQGLLGMASGGATSNGMEEAPFGITKNASNIQHPDMATGGVAATPPPGALSAEVADTVPANLSEGEFVFSADATRYLGLQFLSGLQDHARQELDKMNSDGGIRSPGDGKNPDETGGQFMQDAAPNTDTYSQDDQNVTDDAQPTMNKGGLLGYAAGGTVGKAMNGQGGKIESPGQDVWDKETDKHQSKVLGQGPKSGEAFVEDLKGKDTVKMATGGGLGEESFNKGGIVTSTAPNLTPKKSGATIPGTKTPKLSAPVEPKEPTVPKLKLPKMNKGGLLKRDIQNTQSC